MQIIELGTRDGAGCSERQITKLKGLGEVRRVTEVGGGVKRTQSVQTKISGS